MVGPTARQLGVRVHPTDPHDVKPDTRGNVGPDRFFEGEREGMSVSPSFETLPLHRVPPQFRWLRPDARGNSKDRIFALHANGPFVRTVIDNDLELAPDDEDTPDHGVVQPRRVMHADAFQAALGGTRRRWRIEEPRKGEDDER